MTRPVTLAVVGISLLVGFMLGRIGVHEAPLSADTLLRPKGKTLSMASAKPVATVQTSPAEIGPDSPARPGVKAASVDELAMEIYRRSVADMNDPEVAAVTKADTIDRETRRYARLLPKLQLSPADAARFFGLLAEKRALAIETAAVNQTTTGSSMPVSGAVTIESDKIDREMRDLLGDDRMAAVDYFGRTATARGDVERLQRRLLLTEAPLQEAQFDAIVEASSKHDIPIYSEDFAEVAAQILSPAQQKQLRSLVELKQRQQKLADRHR
jgi:hypothetical protein